MQLLMDHDEERRRETEYWAMFQVRSNLQNSSLCFIMLIRLDE